MYFVPKNRRWHSLFSKVRPLFRYLATGGAGVIVLWGWYYAVYQPLRAQIACLQQEIEQCNVQTAQGDSTMQRAKKQEDILHQLKKELRKHTQGQTVSQQTRRTAHALLKNMSAYKLCLSSYSCNELVAYDWYAKRSLSLVVNDLSLQSLTSFLKDMSQDHLFSCAALRLSRNDTHAVFHLVCTIDCLGIA